MRELGFTLTFDVTGRQSIADLLPASRSRCGIYLLEFANQSFYIGQAVDVVRRYNQHRKNHPDIVRLSFQTVRKSKLNEVERELIHAAERRGIALTNIVHAVAPIVQSDLDALIAPEEQQRWLRDPAALPANTPRTIIAGHEQQRLRYHKQMAQFRAHPQFAELVAALNTYIKRCIIAPQQTEYSFWALSCMPSTNQNIYPRLAVVNAGLMETLVIYYEKQRPADILAFINVAPSVLKNAYPSFKRLERTYGKDNIALRISNYVPAGSDQLQIEVAGLKMLQRILDNAAITAAAPALSLRVMRKNPTLWSRYHCFDLADLIVA